MSNRILITGATGNIGQHLVTELKRAGADFTIMSSKASASAEVPMRHGDFNDIASLEKAFAGIDTVFLLFPLTPNKVELAMNAAQAAKRAGVKHIVRSSGAGADPNAGYALPRLQGTIDKILADTGIPTTFLRPNGFMQNFATFMAGQVKSGALYLADGGQKQSYIDARDIAAVAAKVLMNPDMHAGKAYTLTGGESLAGNDVAAAIAAASGREVKAVTITPEQAVEGMKQYGMPQFMIDLMDSLNHVIAAGYAAGISPDAKNILGREPIRFAQFAKDHAAAWK